MVIILIFISILIVYFTFIFWKSKNLSFNKSIFTTIICTIFIFSIVLKPKLCLNSAINGGKLFLNSVFVSLFPFLVLINIMLSYDGVNIYSKLLGNIICKPLGLPKNCSVVLIISALCGYPLGAKYACDLYEKNVIDFTTFEKLLNIASNPSPLFVIGAVGTSMLGSSHLGIVLLLCNYISCIIMAFILPNKNTLPKHSTENNKSCKLSEINNTTIGNVLNFSISSALKTSFSIGGFIIFFSVITSIIKNNILFDIVFQKFSTIFHIEKTILESIFLGLIEMTNGCSSVSNLKIDTIYKICIISFLLAFSGLSIISQTYSIIYKCNTSLLKYIKRKFFQGIICSILTIISFKYNIFHFAQLTFNNHLAYSGNFVIKLIVIMQVIIVLIPMIIYKINKLFDSFS